jgi:tRNA G18 (ribose-2'-O)-methylase SpoU
MSAEIFARTALQFLVAVSFGLDVAIYFFHCCRRRGTRLFFACQDLANPRAAPQQAHPRRISCPATETNHGRSRQVTQNYNIGAIFRLCDAFLVQQLVICGTKVDLLKRRLVQAARGTQHWVPWTECQHAGEAIADLKARGAWLLVAEQTTASVRPEELAPVFPATLVLGGERSGVSPQVIEAADTVVAIPMLGMANSLNVATTAAILLYWLSARLERLAAV